MTNRGVPLWTALLLVAAPLAAQEQDLLLLVVGQDTIARERVTRAPGRFTGELLLPQPGVRLRYDVVRREDGTVAEFVNRAWPAADPDSAPARQVATFRFSGDSVRMELSNGTSQQFATLPGAVPFVNPSFGLIELLVERAARTGRDSTAVPVFLVQSGQTVSFVVRRGTADSVIVGIGGVDARLRVDPAHRILGGIVPSQGLRIIRASGGMDFVRPPPADYAAPAGAPYRAVEVRIPAPAGHLLAGTLTLPAGASAEARVPALVTATGSGLQERDQSIPGVPGYRLFRQVADTLARHGVAVLRMDDRGFAGSGGDGGNATTQDFAADVAAGVAWLRTRPEIDPARLGVIGHSEGGLVAPLVAARDSTLRGIVLLAAQSRTGSRIIAYQQREAIAQMPGFTDAQRDSVFLDAQATLTRTATASPWLREFMAYDPLPTARQVRRPAVLIVHGETDRQVTVDQAEELAAAFREGGNPDVTVHRAAQANHLLVQDPDGRPSGYSALPTRAVRPDILGVILHWVRERFLP